MHEGGGDLVQGVDVAGAHAGKKCVSPRFDTKKCAWDYRIRRGLADGLGAEKGGVYLEDTQQELSSKNNNGSLHTEKQVCELRNHEQAYARTSCGTRE